MTNKTKKNGFTLVELMFSVMFIGTLLLSIAMLTIQLMNIYNKGLIMREVNSVGNDIVDNIRTAIRRSSSRNINPEPTTSSLGAVIKGKQLFDARKRYYVSNDKKGYGMFCTGSYVYIWNLQRAILPYHDNNDNKSNSNGEFLRIGTNSGNMRPYAFARVANIDGISSFCSDGEVANTLRHDADTTEPWNPDDQHETYDITIKDSNDLQILLDGGSSDANADLQMYDFYIAHATSNPNTAETLYDISFVLGTTRGGINVKSASNYCEGQVIANDDHEPTELEEEMANFGVDYCAVNRFEFVARQSNSAE